jgi:hypothetical protein
VRSLVLFVVDAQRSAVPNPLSIHCILIAASAPMELSQVTPSVAVMLPPVLLVAIFKQLDARFTFSVLVRVSKEFYRIIMSSQQKLLETTRICLHFDGVDSHDRFFWSGGCNAPQCRAQWADINTAQELAFEQTAPPSEIRNGMILYHTRLRVDTTKIKSLLVTAHKMHEFTESLQTEGACLLHWIVRHGLLGNDSLGRPNILQNTITRQLTSGQYLFFNVESTISLKDFFGYHIREE